jgi:transcriptional repressor NrdR
MRCPICHQTSDRVLDSRPSATGDAIRRRRICDACGHRFTTWERIALQMPMVVKKDGQREAFDRDKLLAGIFKAVHRRPVAPERVHDFVRSLEARLSETGEREVESALLGGGVLDFLRATDLIAYVRFASVYKDFADIDALLAEVRPLADNPAAEGTTP